MSEEKRLIDELVAYQGTNPVLVAASLTVRAMTTETDFSIPVQLLPSDLETVVRIVNHQLDQHGKSIVVLPRGEAPAQ